MYTTMNLNDEFLSLFTPAQMKAMIAQKKVAAEKPKEVVAPKKQINFDLELKNIRQKKFQQKKRVAALVEKGMKLLKPEEVKKPAPVKRPRYRTKFEKMNQRYLSAFQSFHKYTGKDVSEEIEEMTDKLKKSVREKARNKRRYAKIVHQYKKQIVETKAKDIKNIFTGARFKDVTKQFEIVPSVYATDIPKFRKENKDLIIAILNKALIDLGGGMKVVLALNCTMEKQLGGGLTTATPWFVSSKFKTAVTILHSKDITRTINTLWSRIEDLFSNFICHGSNWRLKCINKLLINVMKYKPFKGSSYLTLPQFIKDKKCCINVINNDEACFKWACLSALHNSEVQKDAQRVTKYKAWENELDFTGINFPVEVTQVEKFEALNDQPINIFIYINNAKLPSPVHISKRMDKEPINLLLINNNEKSHYVWIKNFSALFASSESKHKAAKHFCYNCLIGFGTKELLESHRGLKCADYEAARVTLPKKGDNIMQFKNVHKQLKVPFAIYADFESLLVPTCGDKYQHHQACGYGYKIVSAYPEHSKEYKSYRGADSVEHFLKSIMEEKQWIMDVVQTNLEMVMTDADKKAFKDATICHICEKELGNDRVRDHDHITSEYRGAAHENCNINYNYKGFKIPVIFHNLKGYDAHLIMSKIGMFDENITVIPNTLEKYISFSMGKFVFLDSLQFVLSGLEALVKITRKAKDDKNLFEHLLAGFPENNQKQNNLLTQKGIYPYDHMKDWKSFDEEKLPSKECFYSKLNKCHVDSEDYERAQLVWKLFKCKNMGDYHDLYLKTDVLLLADVFENFRKICLKAYKLDPLHYFTSPGLSWDSMMKMTDVKIETYTDKQADMSLMIENGNRGGICMITKRFAKANNKYLRGFNEKKMRKFLMYLDANNLYGWAMSQYLPIGDYRWEKPEDFTTESILAMSDEQARGFIFEVDLAYPRQLHDLHSDYPLAPESKAGQDSPLIADIRKRLGGNTEEDKKLIPNLNDKKNYVLHYRNLKLYLKLGLVLTKIHRVQSFEQAPWLKKYIDFNTSKRAAATSDFEKDFFKLMNNSIFGKTMENVRNRIAVNLCTNQEQFLKLTRKPNAKNCMQFNDDLMAVEMGAVSVKMNKPIAVGFSILELSKVLMYDFHYNTIKSKYGEKASLMFTDTDSLCYEIETEDIYEDMGKMGDQFDFSDYPKDHPLYSSKNKKVIGKFKDETNGVAIQEFVGLRAKMYSILVDGKAKKRAKGVKQCVVKGEITHNDYRKAIFSKELKNIQQTCSFNTIRARKHEISTLSQNKVSLSCLENKRHVLEDNIHTRAIGHWKNTE
jgi:hypothetical protein